MIPIIYGRVSTNKQEEARTIKTQLDYILHDPVVTAQFGEIPDKEALLSYIALSDEEASRTKPPESQYHYLDDGVSGYRKPLWERPAGKRLLARARAGELEGVTVLVYKLNRLGRKMIETEQAIDELLSYGVGVYDCKAHMKMDNTPMGKLMRQMMGIFAEFERNNTVDNLRDGLEREARAGTLLPTVLRLGYTWSAFAPDGRKAKGADMVIAEEEAALVRRIFIMYVEGEGPKRKPMSFNEIARVLNAEGHRLPRKSPGFIKWHGTTERLFCAADIRTILMDPLYNGTVSWGKTTRMANGKPTPYTFHMPALQIVSFELWNRAQGIMEHRKRVPRKSINSEYIYSGLIRCPKCGGEPPGKRRLVGSVATIALTTTASARWGVRGGLHLRRLSPRQLFRFW
jgi:site-specific DNA recombinase